jgi:predicted nucleotide-binding protein
VNNGVWINASGDLQKRCKSSHTCTADGTMARARQNVILELGYFVGSLGRTRVVALRKGDLEFPSDYVGVVWTEFDDHGGWKVKLARELEAAKYRIDWNKAMT